MMKVTKEEMAARINGRDVSKTHTEILPEEEKLAEESGLFIICGASDDLMEVYGVQREEYGAGGKCDKFNFGWRKGSNEQGVIEIDEDHLEILAEYGFDKVLLEHTRPLYSCWGAKDSEFTWSYKTEIPHATFDIFDDGEKFCRGIIISVKDL